jgi:TIR domain
VTTDSESPFRFDVALSFAGEDRNYVDNIAAQLRERGLRVFYDKYEQATLWGKDLYEHLDKVYQQEARYCVLFASEHYARKVWTTHERRSAQARALNNKEEYILPVRFDDTEIPGLRPTIGYVDTRSTTPDEIIDLILQKAQQSMVQARPIAAPDRIPRTAEQRRELLARRPAVWEYLLFAGILAEGKDALEPKWRDHQLRFVPKAGPLLSDAEAPSFIPKAMHELLILVRNFDRILGSQVKESPEVSGDPDHIEYLGRRVLKVYEDLLDWSARIRSMHTILRFFRRTS